MKLFLDDLRTTTDCLIHMQDRIGEQVMIYASTDWLIARNYEQFVTLVKTYAPEITLISFDHDLSNEHYHPYMFVSAEMYNQLYETFEEKTGFHCAEWLKKYYEENGYIIPEIIVHSMNPVGTANIKKLF